MKSKYAQLRAIHYHYSYLMKKQWALMKELNEPLWEELEKKYKYTGNKIKYFNKLTKKEN